MNNQLYDEFFESFNQFINVANVIKEIADSDEEDHLVAVPADVYGYLGRPLYVRTEHGDELNFVLDYSDAAVMRRIAESAVDVSIKTLNTFQREITDSLFSPVSLYRGREIDAESAVYFVQMIYVTLLKVYEVTARNIATLSGTELDEKTLQERDQLIDNLVRDIRKEKDKFKRQFDKPRSQIENELNSLQRSFDSLNKELGHEKQNVRREAEKNEQMRLSAERDREELNSLRELIFALRTDEQEPEPDNTVAFPYRIEKNVYVLGGHETWVKQMKELLPDLKYLNKDNNINLDKLANADAVWFQVNALSHSQFYSAVNIAEKSNVPVMYFKYNSAKQCAVQFVKDSI